MVTILFADLVDSTGLAQSLDPERAREVLGRFFDAASEELTTLRGRPEKFIGDAVMAVFGLPHVHEDDALRAVRAGLAIRERVRRLGGELGLGRQLEVRIGIESGDAAVGRSPSGQLLVTGPVVNAAKRLEAAAPSGQILVGQTTYLLTSANVSYARRRRVRAKGFDSSLDAFAVEDLSPRSARRTIPFVGRASEQAILGQSLGAASTSGRPVLATVVGEAGIGKSRLADELAAGVSAAVMILRGQARALTDTATFSPVAAIVGDLAGIRPGDAPDQVRERLRDLAGRVSESGSPAADRTAQRLALLFGQADGIDEAAFVPEVHAGFIAVIDGLSRDHPVLVLFEDAHTLKAPMLDLIERLGSRGDGPRRALILTLARNELLEQRPTWGSSSGNAVLLRLETLSRNESVQLARHAGGGHIGDAEAVEIAERAGGNPYFIIETTGMLMPSAGSDGQGPRPVPPTVQAVVSARMDALPARLRELARKAAVFKYSFGLNELRVVDADTTPEEIQQMEDAEILVRDPEPGDYPRWRMRHATLKDVVYASVPKRERERLHQLLATNLLDTGHPSLAADHLELAAMAALDLDPTNRELPDRAAEALLFAGDRARRRMESKTAIDRYQRALALVGPEDRWGVREARILAGMGESHYWLGEYPAATETLNRAVALGEVHRDAFALALALRYLGDIAINFEGDVDRAERLLNRSLKAAEELGDPWAIARSLVFAGWVPWTRGRYEEAEQVWLRVLDLVDPKDHWARVRALTALSVNRSDMGDNEAALARIEEAGDLAEETGDRFTIANTLVQKARVLDDLGRSAEALPCFDRGVATFAELGARWEMADARAARGIAYRNLGRLDEAESELRFAIRTAEELGDRQIPPWTWRNLAKVAELRGDQVTADDFLQRSRDAASRGPH